MTRTPLKISIPIAVAAAAVAFPTIASARIVPCDGDGLTTPCHGKVALPTTPDVRHLVRKQSRLAQAAAFRAIRTGQWSGPYDSHRADG